MIISISQVVSRDSRHAAALLFAVVALSGCFSTSGPAKTSLQLQSFQAKEFETTKQTAFAATMSVFQDLAYTIRSADLETGFITAKSPTRQTRRFLGNRHMRDIKATAYVETMGNRRARVRLNFVKSIETANKHGVIAREDVPVEDPVVYRDTFNRLRKAIFVRQSTGLR